MITVQAEQLDPEYQVDCPHCGETHYSSSTPDWDVYEAFHYDIIITCTDCKEQFSVSQ